MKQSRLLLTLAGAVIVVILVTGATVWMSRGAQHATDAAVEPAAAARLSAASSTPRRKG